MGLRRHLATVAVAATTLAAAAPASAEPVGRFTQSGSGQNLASPTSSTVNLSFQCTATALGGSDVRITECYLRGADGTTIQAPTTPVGKPGADATGGLAINAPAQAYDVCVQSEAFYGPIHLTNDLDCSGGLLPSP